MTPPRFAVYLMYLLLGRIVQTTDVKSTVYVRQDSDLKSADVGDNVTLRCFYEESTVMSYWYKQTRGLNLRLVSRFYRHEKSATFSDEFRHNPRFKLETGNGNNHLTILNLHVSDSATYYCAGSLGNDLEFAEGVTISVKGSGLEVQTLVHQSDGIQPGSAMNLNCVIHNGTCDGEHSVYWFRDSGEPHSGLIYTSGGQNDQCERKQDTQTHSCFYELPTKGLDHSQYCALASCGRILFGNMETLDGKGSSVLVYLLSGALAFTIILTVFLVYAAYSMYKRNNCKCTASRSSTSLTLNAEGQQDSDTLHYAALRPHQVNASMRQRDNMHSECVYSRVRQ